MHNTSIHSVIAPQVQIAKIPRPASSQGSGLMPSSNVSAVISSNLNGSSVLPSSNGSGLMQVPQAQNLQTSQTSLYHQNQLDKRSRIS